MFACYQRRRQITFSNRQCILLETCWIITTRRRRRRSILISLAHSEWKLELSSLGRRERLINRGGIGSARREIKSTPRIIRMAMMMMNVLTSTRNK